MTKQQVFRAPIQKANSWINEIADGMNWNDHRRALHAFRAVLHSLRDQLSINEMADLSAQLPLVVRGLFFENWRPHVASGHSRSVEGFRDSLAKQLPELSNAEITQVTQVVMNVIARHVSAGEISDIGSNLPESIRSLWDQAVMP